MSDLGHSMSLDDSGKGGEVGVWDGTSASLTCPPLCTTMEKEKGTEMNFLFSCCSQTKPLWPLDSRGRMLCFCAALVLVVDFNLVQDGRGLFSKEIPFLSGKNKQTENACAGVRALVFVLSPSLSQLSDNGTKWCQLKCILCV